jgi:hypothetical protein
MTAQHHEDQLDAQPETTTDPDPLGPITLPKRTRVGARAMALLGTVGLSAFGAVAATDVYSTWPTISVN